MDWLGKMMGLPQAFLAIDSDGNRGKGGGVVQVRMPTPAPCTALVLPSQPAMRKHLVYCTFKASLGHRSARPPGLLLVTMPLWHSTTMYVCM